MVYAASSFHWIPEAVGYAKVWSMLKPGGVFARFANHPYADKGRPQLDADIQSLYAQYMPGNLRPAEYSLEMAQNHARIAEKYGFTDIQCAIFHRTRTFTAREYITLLGTYSDHIALEESRRNAFWGKVEDAILAHGGSITIYDTLDLQLARKPA